MKGNLRKMIPYLLVNVIAFYILPMIIRDTGTAMFVLLVGIPLICFATAIVFSMKNSFNWIYPLSVTLLFIPTIFIFYNSSAVIYIVAYGIIALVGSFIGSLINKRMKQP